MNEVYIQGIGQVVCIVPQGETLKQLPEKVIFSNHRVPDIGETVLVTMNGLGHAIVLDYKEQAGFLAVRVKFENPPEWYVRQNGSNVPGYVFGIDMEL